MRLRLIRPVVLNTLSRICMRWARCPTCIACDQRANKLCGPCTCGLCSSGANCMALRKDRGGGRPWPLHVLHLTLSPSSLYTLRPFTSPSLSPLPRFCAATAPSPEATTATTTTTTAGKVRERYESVRPLSQSVVVRLIIFHRVPSRRN